MGEALLLDRDTAATPPPAAPEGPQERCERVVEGMAWKLQSAPSDERKWTVLTTGERAALRRLDPERLGEPAFWKLLADIALGELDRRHEQDQPRWAMIAAGMARMAPFHHSRNEPLGRVLGEVGFHEGRLEKLLRARGEHVWPTVRRMCDVLAAHARPVDWRPLGLLLLIHDRHEEWAERLRLRIARDFYAATASRDKEGKA